MAARASVLVCHPGRQHSYRAAAGLAEAGLLAGYWAGLPPAAEEGPAGLRGEAGLRIVRFRWAPLLRRLLERTLPGRSRWWGDHLANRLFDHWSASRLRQVRPSLVVGYETASERLFASARSLGAATVLDAASLHHAAQDRWREVSEREGLHGRICAVKDHELDLADHVIVASSLAEETYLAGDVRPERISVVPLGVDLARFRMGRGGSGALNVLFAGKLSATKGVDLLLAAFGGLRRGHPSARLRLAGQGRWSGGLPEGAQLFRPAPAELVAAYQAADLLVLPSRLDGFGLVVAEALACGTPVIVSDRVGAKDLVVEGVNGWIVAGEDVEALTARLEWCAGNLGSVRAMRTACAASVRESGWDAYSRRFVGVIEKLLAGRTR